MSRAEYGSGVSAVQPVHLAVPVPDDGGRSADGHAIAFPLLSLLPGSDREPGDEGVQRGGQADGAAAQAEQGAAVSVLMPQASQAGLTNRT